MSRLQWAAGEKLCHIPQALTEKEHVMKRCTSNQVRQKTNRNEKNEKYIETKKGHVMKRCTSNQSPTENERKETERKREGESGGERERERESGGGRERRRERAERSGAERSGAERSA